MRIRSATAAVGVVACVAALWPAAAPLAQDTGCAGADATGPPAVLQDAALCLVNQQRATVGAAPLVVSGLLAGAAVAHLGDMANRDYFSVTSPDGAGAAERAFAAGYGTDGTRSAGEVIYAGTDTFVTPRSAVSSWMADPTQRAIILGTGKTDAGAAAGEVTTGQFAPSTTLYSFFAGGPSQLAPIADRTTVLRNVGGDVTITPPGGGPSRPLTAESAIPLGSKIDATHGHVQMITATDRRKGTESSRFYDGAFVVRQLPFQHREGDARSLTTVLRLAGGNFAAACEGAASATRARSAAVHKPVRRLWGTGKGKYRTEGRVASATVRGTTWLTEDTCDGTRVHVRHGVVRVRDLQNGHTVSVPAGHTVFIRRR